jgi:hypothetical protein
VHGLDQRPTAALPCQPPLLGGTTADLGLDLIQCGNALQRLGGDGRLVGGMDVEELPSCVSPAEGELRRFVAASVTRRLNPA